MMRLIVALLLVVVWTGYPPVSFADEGSDADNKQCEGKKDGTPVKSKTRDIEGTCQGGKFSAEKAGGQALDKALQALMQALQSAMGGKGGGGSGGGGAPQPGQTPTNPLGGATGLLNSLTGHTTGNVRSSVGDILNGVFKDDNTTETTILDTARQEEGTDTTISALIEGEEDGAASEGTSVTTVSSGTTVVPVVDGGSVGSTVVGEEDEVRGDIIERADSTTVEGSIHSPTKNTEVAGFFGSNASGESGGSGLVGRVCASRPWANSFLSRFVSDSFFDGLCRRLGFSAGAAVVNEPLNTTAAERVAVERTEAVKQNPTTATGEARTTGITCSPNVVRVGAQATLDFSCKAGASLTAVAGFSAKSYTDTTAVVSPGRTTKYGIQCSDGIVYTCTVEVIDPKLSIWAEPKEASLGSRVEVYWSASDVVADTCIVRGPSFNERGATGGAATVPIYDPSTFTLSCLARDGATTTASVIVDLAL